MSPEIVEKKKKKSSVYFHLLLEPSNKFIHDCGENIFEQEYVFLVLTEQTLSLIEIIICGKVNLHTLHWGVKATLNHLYACDFSVFYSTSDFQGSLEVNVRMI